MSGQFSHINIVIILMYIAGHNLLGIAYAVNCSERYMLGHRNYHGLAINRVGHHLKATRDKVLMLNPSHYLYKVEWFTDYDFTGMYGNDKYHLSTMCEKQNSFWDNLCKLKHTLANQNFIQILPKLIHRLKWLTWTIVLMSCFLFFRWLKILVER